MPHQDHERNRAMWNEIVDVHFLHPSYRTQQFLNGGSSLKQLEQDELGDVSNKTLLHLMCQFGLDTLSWARQGAIVTGVDISDRSIERANELKAASGLTDARFIRSDLLDLRSVVTEQFDIVYQSYGTLCWLADIKRWGEVVAACLKPGGTFLLIDDHPCSLAIYPTALSYFSTEAETLENQPDYADRSYVRTNPSTEWQHTLADILNSLIGAGLTIQKIGEYDYSYYQVLEDWYAVGDRWYPPSGKSKFPLMLLLRAAT
jgi:SAM-dependent methyltransferase